MRNLQINPVTMTSIAVAGLVGKEPKTVNRDIREMVAGLDGTDLYHDFLAEKTEDKRGYTKFYTLNKFAVELLMLGYSLELRAKVLQYVYDLEKENETLKAAIIDRQHSRLESPELTAALKESRALEGKDTLNRHYINEYNLLNRLVLGTTAKKYIEENGFSPSTAIRDTMRPVEIKAMAELQRVNTSLIEMGLDYPARKPLLIELYNRKFKQPLIDELMKIES